MAEISVSYTDEYPIKPGLEANVFPQGARGGYYQQSQIAAKWPAVGIIKPATERTGASDNVAVNNSNITYWITG